MLYQFAGNHFYINHVAYACISRAVTLSIFHGHFRNLPAKCANLIKTSIS